MAPTYEDVVKEIATEILTQAGFPTVQIIVRHAQEGEKPFVVCDLVTETESNFLIGQHGTNLRALQHLLRIIVRKRTGDADLGLVVDVNGYQKDRQESLIQRAQEAAAQAVRDHKPVTLPPLSAYERRVVHMELARRDDVHTESVGTGEERHVVVRPRGSGE